MTKQLLQQALDYVESVPDDRCWGDYRDHQALEEALRAAIADVEAIDTSPERVRNSAESVQVEPRACLVETEQGDMVWPIADFTEAGTYCEMDEFPIYLYTAPPDTEALRKELERVKGERDAMAKNAERWKMLTKFEAARMTPDRIAHYISHPAQLDFATGIDDSVVAKSTVVAAQGEGA